MSGKDDRMSEEQRAIRELESKRGELESLYHSTVALESEISSLESKVPARYRDVGKTRPGGDGKTSDAEFLRVQNNQRALLGEIEILTDKNKTLDGLLEAKTRALHKAIEDTVLANDRIETLNKNIHQLKTENLKLKDQVSSAQSTATKGSASYKNELQGTEKEDYFFLLDRLENEIKVKDAEIAELWSDRKTLDVQLKRKDQVIDKLTEEMKRQSQSYEDVAVLEGKVREFTKKIEEIQQENKLLNNLCRVKTQAIEQLQVKINENAHSHEYVKQLEMAVRNKERVIESLQEDAEQHESILRKRDEEINRIAEAAANSTSGMNFREWYEERKGLKSKIETLDASRASQEKIIRSQHQRINQLAGRLETLQRSLSDTAAMSPRHAGMMATPRRPGGGVFVDEDGQEMIAAELYDALARDVHIMKIKLEEKDNMLIEKDDVIECYERKNEVLAKTYAQEKKKLSREKLEMSDEINKLKSSLDQKEIDVKNTVQQLNKDKLQLKKDLTRAKEARRRPGSSYTGSRGGTPRGEIQ